MGGGGGKSASASSLASSLSSTGGSESGASPYPSIDGAVGAVGAGRVGDGVGREQSAGYDTISADPDEILAEQANHFGMVFDQIDSSRNGYITADDLAAALQLAGRSPADISDLVARVRDMRVVCLCVFFCIKPTSGYVRTRFGNCVHAYVCIRTRSLALKHAPPTNPVVCYPIPIDVC